MVYPASFLVNVFITGIGATLVMDAWTLCRKRMFGIAPPDYALVGRWFAHMIHGRFRHEAIAAAAAVPGETGIGWTAHYLTGLGFAALLPVLWGEAWLRQPALGPALLVGICTVAAPFLLMQPGMGAGIAASRTRHPAAARLHSLLTHGVFGIGLYFAGSVSSAALATLARP